MVRANAPKPAGHSKLPASKAAKVAAYRSQQTRNWNLEGPSTRLPGLQEKAAAAAKPPAPAPAPSPFLTAAEMAAYEKSYTNEQNSINNDINAENGDLSKYNANITANGARYAQAGDSSNWSLAARGLGQSSVRDSDLNDLAATYTTNAYNYATNFNTNLARYASAINTAQSNQGILQNEYNDMAVGNAEGLTPNLGANPSAVPGTNFGFDLTDLTNTATQNATPTSQQAVTQGVNAPTYGVAQAPAVDRVDPIGAHNQNFTLGSQMATSNPALAAIASQRAGYSTPQQPPVPKLTSTGAPSVPTIAAPPVT